MLRVTFANLSDEMSKRVGAAIIQLSTTRSLPSFKGATPYKQSVPTRG